MGEDQDRTRVLPRRERVGLPDVADEAPASARTEAVTQPVGRPRKPFPAQDPQAGDPTDVDGELAFEEGSDLEDLQELAEDGPSPADEAPPGLVDTSPGRRRRRARDPDDITHKRERDATRRLPRGERRLSQVKTDPRSTGGSGRDIPTFKSRPPRMRMAEDVEAPAGVSGAARLLARETAGWVRGAVSERRTVVVGGAVAVAVVGIALLALGGGGDLSADQLAEFYAHVEGARFAEAEAMLADLSPPDEVADGLRGHLERSRAAAARKHRQKATRAFGKKKYAEAFEAATLAEEAASTADSAFLLAEAARLSGRAEAGEAYRRFLDRYGDDARRDDALFWWAESLVAQGRLDEARKAFGEVASMAKSNFRRSAQRRLNEL